MRDYKDTLNLPETEFPMRGNLPAREPELLARWDEIDLYRRMQEKNEGRPRFILHDGPPFSNGNIHMGTAMNKVLKDVINKSKTMEGYQTPYIPGWDNHGMPIESAIIKQSKLDRKRMTVPEFRLACKRFAEKFVELQRESFERLGVVGDWKRPYLTMNPSFEAREVKVFGKMFEKGFIYKGVKPVYWCAHDETALAEAEIEYQDAPCTSVYVKFRVADDKGLLGGSFDLQKTYFVIWTTTPWTLPGNVAIAVHPRESYCAVKAGDEVYLMAEALVGEVMKAAGIGEYEIVRTGFTGQDFEYMTAFHPFLPRESLLCCAEYVTMDSGTGCVHTAPGYGAEDFRTGQKYGLDVPVPVDDRGVQGEAAGKFAGLRYDESNAAIVADLKESGALLAAKEIVHSYPHCWRCKKPVIYRATEQWFCSVGAFRDEAVRACDEVEWMPAWGKERMQEMITERSDWCISRQRKWGLPIPVFYCKDCGKVVCDEKTVAHVSALFGEAGSNVWFEKEAKELLPEGYVCPHCGGNSFDKESDTLDGWFDSGSTHFDVLDGRGLPRPCDLYLEGGDQYRGWFQSSLLTAIGSGLGQAPYKAVLTHGWTVDGEGKAMHKSLGNVVAPESIIKVYGADILRLWVASSDYRADVRCSDALFRQLSDNYRKLRNTCRILLADLGTPESDFDPARDMVPFGKMPDIDKWILTRLNGLVRACREAYDRYEFHVICHDVQNFCTIDLSKLYIDITKDRLYCSRKDDPLRRSAQTAMYLVIRSLTLLLAPILSFTAEELWGYMSLTEGDDPVSVFCNPLPEFRPDMDFPEIAEKYRGLLEDRDDVMKALELARADRIIGKSLEAKVTLFGKADNGAMKRFLAHREELEELFIVSGVELSDAEAPAGAFTETQSGVAVLVEPAEGKKCGRCWTFRSDCEPDGEDGYLCPRCRKALC